MDRRRCSGRIGNRRKIGRAADAIEAEPDVHIDDVVEGPAVARAELAPVAHHRAIDRRVPAALATSRQLEIVTAAKGRAALTSRVEEVGDERPEPAVVLLLGVGLEQVVDHRLVFWLRRRRPKAE